MQLGPPPPTRGGNYFIKSFLFNPYPAIPPYYIRTLHPGMRPTKTTSWNKADKMAVEYQWDTYTTYAHGQMETPGAPKGLPGGGSDPRRGLEAKNMEFLKSN